MDARWKAARDGGIVLVITVVVAVIVSQREPDKNDDLPAQVSLVAPATPQTERLYFLVRGSGCFEPQDSQAKGRVEERISGGTIQYVDDEIRIRFRAREPAPQDRCAGPQSHVLRILTLATPIGDRTLVDANTGQPIPVEPPP